LRAWNVLQRLRAILSETGNVAIPPPAQKKSDAEGEILEHGLTKSFRIRDEAIKSLCSSVRRFRDATIKAECRSDYPHALQALWKALDRRRRFDSELRPVTLEIKTEMPSLILRLLREQDAGELLLRNDQNRDHLRQWMPWLDETKSASDTLNFIRRSLESATAGTQYHYALLLEGV
jgi:hypothetical protein